MTLGSKGAVALANWDAPPPPAEISGVWYGLADQIPMSIASTYTVRPLHASLRPPSTRLVSAKCAVDAACCEMHGASYTCVQHCMQPAKAGLCMITYVLILNADCWAVPKLFSQRGRF